ncbi:helix-turn-helix transcriptional regulator [Chryseosolibacter indicus]|uniref:Helix-turn-helix transcriptional regulator n=1 Tax=Chryseosolibacter indicus TaxID=2782351 RepID=A0ABS5VPU5_9BACT|nr:helix-turn-helix transcriptional regulator [Chryseosolibacter indicus]MBT1702817.1 helix-turn-helix transcriptional regulator [Chryseosolibacter indicus]
MNLREIIPGEKLRPYVKCYFIFESEGDVEVSDVVFPNGFMEIMFNLGDGLWKSAVDNVFYTTPPVELWGQLTRPLPIKAKGKNMMLGIRFFSHTAAYFLNEEVSEFNDQIADLRDLLGASVRTLHERLMNVTLLSKRIALIENFLENRLSVTERRKHKISLVAGIINDMKHAAFSDDMAAVASRYNITPRYMQKLFLTYTGVSPKMFGKINRFQQSLQLVQKKEATLTSIAHECGYFDQSHFIREFKSFTGFTPSAYSPENFPVSQAFANI